MLNKIFTTKIIIFILLLSLIFNIAFITNYFKIKYYFTSYVRNEVSNIHIALSDIDNLINNHILDYDFTKSNNAQKMNDVKNLLNDLSKYYFHFKVYKRFIGKKADTEGLNVTLLSDTFRYYSCYASGYITKENFSNDKTLTLLMSDLKELLRILQYDHTRDHVEDDTKFINNFNSNTVNKELNDFVHSSELLKSYFKYY